MDPNWFYSTLAQSSATIAGILGGFLTARVLADYGLAQAQARELERAYWRALQIFIRMGWELPMKAAFLHHGASDLRNGVPHYPWIVHAQALQHGANPASSPSRGFADAADSVADFLERISMETRDLMPRQIHLDQTSWAREKTVFDSLAREAETVRNGIRDRKDLSDVDEGIISMYLAQEWQPITDFQMLYRGLEHDYARFVEGLRGRPYYVGLFILGAIVLATVVGPMLRLSAHGSSDKALFLALLVVGLLVLAAYIKGLIARLWTLREIGQQNEGLALWEMNRSR